MCKRVGCDLDPHWQAGRWAGLCEACAAEPIAAWRADPTARRADGCGCEWRGCRERATVRLFYGAPNIYNGRQCPGVNYCAAHADRTRALFRIDREDAPSLTRSYEPGEPCGARTQAGGSCRRPRTPGEPTCPSHRAVAA